MSASHRLEALHERLNRRFAPDGQVAESAHDPVMFAVQATQAAVLEAHQQVDSNDPILQLQADQAMTRAHAAFAEVVAMTYEESYAVAVARVGIPVHKGTIKKMEAEDVLQEAYFRAFRSIHKFNGDAKFSTWMYRIIVNCANTRYRIEHRNRYVPMPSQADESGAEFSGYAQFIGGTHLRKTDDYVVLTEGKRTLMKLINHLSPNDREVVMLHSIHDLSYEKILELRGDELNNKNETRLKVRHHRALKKLKGLLCAMGIESHQDLI